MSSLKIPTKANLWWWSTHRKKMSNVVNNTSLTLILRKYVLSVLTVGAIPFLV